MRRAGKDKARKTCVNRRGSLMGLRPWPFDLPLEAHDAPCDEADEHEAQRHRAQPAKAVKSSKHLHLVFSGDKPAVLRGDEMSIVVSTSRYRVSSGHDAEVFAPPYAGRRTGGAKPLTRQASAASSPAWTAGRRLSQLGAACVPEYGRRASRAGILPALCRWTRRWLWLTPAVCAVLDSARRPARCAGRRGFAPQLAAVPWAELWRLGPPARVGSPRAHLIRLGRMRARGLRAGCPGPPVDVILTSWGSRRHPRNRQSSDLESEDSEPHAPRSRPQCLIRTSSGGQPDRHSSSACWSSTCHKQGR